MPCQGSCAGEPVAVHLVVKGDLRFVLCCGPGPPRLFLVAYRSSCPAPPDPAAVLFQRLNDDVHSHVHEISMPELRLDDLLRLSKESSPVEA